MAERVFGLPWPVWGGLALLLALVWCFVWPSDKVSSTTGSMQFFLLRWGHALVWLLLATMCFLKASGTSMLAGWANAVGMLGGLTYAAFLFVYIG
ncbi:MAG: hypothetical protein MUD01_21645 [Chloroflexaceae bacterium]|jgi:hypothetical protein|nr:hypothetical protein [Chloroflexaceae bacterium]